jgi:hypothetical protein
MGRPARGALYAQCANRAEAIGGHVALPAASERDGAGVQGPTRSVAHARSPVAGSDGRAVRGRTGLPPWAISGSRGNAVVTGAEDGGVDPLVAERRLVAQGGVPPMGVVPAFDRRAAAEDREQCDSQRMNPIAPRAGPTDVANGPHTHWRSTA